MKKVLVVDGSETVLQNLKVELKKYDAIEPIFANSYKDALPLINEYKSEIQAAILDYNLPDAPQGQVIALANSYEIPTVILTAALNKEIKDMILENSVFDFILKNDQASIQSAINSINRALKNYDTTVLIVDDSKVYRQRLKMSLEKIHLNIIEAKDGQEALDIIESGAHDIHLIITDYEMPVLDGLDLTFKLREKYSKAQLGIIAMSSSEDENTTSKFLKFGANDFINKPFKHSEVVTTINANLELLTLFEQMQEMANKDFLTGLYNRRYFFESGEAIFLKAKRKNAPLAVAMLDIDKFKNINDTYGHNVGDIAIKELKKVLEKNLRRSELVARFGGEEFCILIEDITLEDVQRLFEKIRKSFEDNIIDAGEVCLSYTVSTGVYYGMAETLEEMVRLSDEALYYAKENGRNQVKMNTGA